MTDVFYILLVRSCPELSDYAFFYYNGKVVMDPWMKETKQDLTWPDHEDKKVVVDPVKHYGEELPDSKRIYFDMLKLPENLVRIVSTGWQREITFHKDDAAKVMELLYPEGCKFDYKKLVNRCQDRVVRLIGFGD